MLQVLQDLKNGQVRIAPVPVPQVLPGQVLIASESSLISKGTEKMILDFGRASYLNKARQQPDKVKMVLNKVRTDGLIPTVEAVTGKLNQPLALGYSNVGKVVDLGEGVKGFSIGDRVVSNGHHAEVVSVPQNLCAKIPDGVPSSVAAFTVVGAIGLQGIRLAQPTLGETFVVTGLGLIGLLAIQILKANGCRVLGLDFDESKVELAKKMGFEALNPSQQDPVIAAQNFSNGYGIDGVIVTASTTSNDPLYQAAEMCRRKGRVVLVGVTGMELNRTLFFKKELSFQVSCSYGPGRYDPQYEEKGLDYPLAYVRWTEQRNFQAILDLMDSGHLKVDHLISHRFHINKAQEAYDMIGDSGKPVLGLIIDYPKSEQSVTQKKIIREKTHKRAPSPKVSFIGAGNYGARFLMPAFKKAGASFESIITNQGVNSFVNGEKFDFKNMTSNIEDIYSDESDVIVIATRHNEHGQQVLRALEAGKSVFVEKPLCIHMDELEAIENRLSEEGSKGQLMVGFNRRFSPFVVAAKKELMCLESPKIVQIKVNGGMIPSDHWTQDLEVGGRRFIGEGCHFIDLAQHLIGQPITHWSTQSTRPRNSAYNREDQWVINLEFAKGSMASVMYFSNGHKSIPKEQIEVHCDGMSFQIDNFRNFRSFGWKRLKSQKNWSQNKGQQECIKQFLGKVKEGKPLICPREILEVARVTISAAETLRR